MRWWQSIRWRLALGSALVALLATTLLGLAAFGAIVYYYGNEQNVRLQGLASGAAQNISDDYTTSTSVNLSNRLRQAATMAFVHSVNAGGNGLIGSTQGTQYIVLVFNTSHVPVYPVLSRLSRPSPVLALVHVLRATSPYSGYMPFRKAIQQGEQGITTMGAIGQGRFGLPARSFVVQPITSGQSGSGTLIGVLAVVPRTAAENTVPPFVATVGQVVLIAAIFVAILAALAAIIFSRTITRPLAKLTQAAHVLSAGDYNARVTTNAQGELGELAHSFNEMATQLKRDVEELQQQEVWRRELLMSITHDLATPLTAIAGLGESLADGVTQSYEDYEATGRIIVRETLRLRRLVKDLHMMARVEAGALQPVAKDVRLAVLVDEVLAVLAPEFERVDVEPRNLIPYNLPVVQADADMLTRVFSNLCDNALRHTPTGGIVTIEALQQADMLVVSVSDTGEGIPAEALSRIFERFFRADSARQSSTGGSGLGLAIVRAIVEAHGGQVWAENGPEGGARIAFTLPLPVAQPQTGVEARTLPLV